MAFSPLRVEKSFTLWSMREFEGLQDAVENRGKYTAEGVGELTCLEIVQPSKEVIESESWKDFYELMPGQFRKHQRTGKKSQIYKVRCVAEKSDFCIFWDQILPILGLWYHEADKHN